MTLSLTLPTEALEQPAMDYALLRSTGIQILERLSDLQFLTWSNRIVTTIATYYVGYGLVLLAGVA